MLMHLARFFSTLFPVKPNEWDGVVYFFFIMLVYSIGASFSRTIGTTLLVSHLGGDKLPVAFIVVDLSVMVGSLAYAHYTKKVTGLAILGFFFLTNTLFSIIIQGLFFLHEQFETGMNIGGYVFSLEWIYGLFFVGFYFFYILINIHISSVIASYFTAVQVKRVMPVISAGMPIGGALGGMMFMLLLNIFQFQPQRLVFVLGLASLVSFGMLHLVKSRLTPVRASVDNRSTKNPFRELVGAFKYVAGSKLMIFMSLGLMCFVIGSKLLEYQYQVIIYPKVYPSENERATFFATYEIFANLMLLFVQLFITSRLIVSLGVGASNMLYPLLSGLAALGLTLYFTQWYSPPTALPVMYPDAALMLGLAIFAQFINQEMRTALRAPAHNMLFNAIPPNQWGTNKAFLNGIVFPVSTVIAGTTTLVLAAGTGIGGVEDPELLASNLAAEYPVTYILPIIAVVTAILGMLVSLPQWAAYNQGVFGLLNRELFDGRGGELKANTRSNNLRQVIEEKLSSADHYHVIAALEMIRVLRLGFFATQVGNLLLKTSNNEIKKHCINTLAALPQSNTNITYLIEALKTEKDDTVIPQILKNLSLFKNVNLNAHIEKLLSNETPAIFVEACLCLYKHPLYPRKQEIERKILARVGKPPVTAEERAQFPLYLYAVGEMKKPAHSNMVLPFIEHNSVEISTAAFTAYVRMLEGNLEPHKDMLIKALSSASKDMKITALRALKECQPLKDWSPIIHLLGVKDRTIVSESKELLRLNLLDCKNALIAHVYSHNATVQERFECLSLIYNKLTDGQQKKLRDMADDSLKRFVRVNGLLKLHLMINWKTKTYDLICKILQEIAENYLLNVLTVITYASEQNLEFFQRVSRGLLSNSRANQGNALEVLSNAGEKYLSGRVLRYFDEKISDIQAVNRIHVALFGENLRIDEGSYISELIRLDHPMLRACLHYIQKEKTGHFKLKGAPKEAVNLLQAEGQVLVETVEEPKPKPKPKNRKEVLEAKRLAAKKAMQKAKRQQQRASLPVLKDKVDVKEIKKVRHKTAKTTKPSDTSK
jgi:ATP/ADP translocase